MSDCERCGGTGVVGGAPDFIGDESGVTMSYCPDCRPTKSDPVSSRLVDEIDRLRDLLRRALDRLEWWNASEFMDHKRTCELMDAIRRELEKGGDASWESRVKTSNVGADFHTPMSDDAPSYYTTLVEQAATALFTIRGIMDPMPEVLTLRQKDGWIIELRPDEGLDDAPSVEPTVPEKETHRAGSHRQPAGPPTGSPEGCICDHGFGMHLSCPVHAPSVGKDTGAGMESLTENPVADHAAKTTGKTGQERAGDKPEATERPRSSTRSGLPDGCQPEGRILSDDEWEANMDRVQENQPDQWEAYERLRLDREALRERAAMYENKWREEGARYVTWRQRAETAEAALAAWKGYGVALRDIVAAIQRREGGDGGTE